MSFHLIQYTVQHKNRKTTRIY